MALKSRELYPFALLFFCTSFAQRRAAIQLLTYGMVSTPWISPDIVVLVTPYFCMIANTSSQMFRHCVRKMVPASMMESISTGVYAFAIMFSFGDGVLYLCSETVTCLVNPPSQLLDGVSVWENKRIAHQEIVNLDKDERESIEQTAELEVPLRTQSDVGEIPNICTRFALVQQQRRRVTGKIHIM
ncbi:hypothetical protein V8B97DRAFT_1918625 [Scleroderma yunnanense]